MRFDAQRGLSKELSSRIAALIAIAAILLFAFPCATPAQTAPAMQAQTDMACCPPDHTLTTPSLCCIIHPEPASLVTPHTPQPPALIATTLPIQPTIRAISPSARRASSPESPPPLLRPILRI